MAAEPTTLVPLTGHVRDPFTLAVERLVAKQRTDAATLTRAAEVIMRRHPAAHGLRSRRVRRILHKWADEISAGNFRQ